MLRNTKNQLVDILQRAQPTDSNPVQEPVREASRCPRVLRKTLALLPLDTARAAAAGGG